MSMSVTHKVAAAIMELGRAVVVGWTIHHAAKYKTLRARNIGGSYSGGARLFEWMVTFCFSLFLYCTTLILLVLLELKTLLCVLSTEIRYIEAWSSYVVKIQFQLQFSARTPTFHKSDPAALAVGICCAEVT